MSQLCFNWPIFLKLVTGFMWESFMQIWKRRVPRQPLRGWEGPSSHTKVRAATLSSSITFREIMSASDIPLVSPRMWYLLVLHVELPTKPKAWSVQVEISLTHCNLLSCYSDFSPSFFFEFNVGQSPAILWSLGISSNVMWGHIVLRTTISPLCPLYPSTHPHPRHGTCCCLLLDCVCLPLVMKPDSESLENDYVLFSFSGCVSLMCTNLWELNNSSVTTG